MMIFTEMNNMSCYWLIVVIGLAIMIAVYSHYHSALNLRPENSIADVVRMLNPGALSSLHYDGTCKHCR